LDTTSAKRGWNLIVQGTALLRTRLVTEKTTTAMAKWTKEFFVLAPTNAVQAGRFVIKEAGGHVLLPLQPLRRATGKTMTVTESLIIQNSY
jgi:hypothetical protein